MYTLNEKWFVVHKLIISSEKDTVTKCCLGLIMLFLLNTHSTKAQFDAQTSQYMLNVSAFNPAAVGAGDMIEIAGQHRMQWIGFPNAGTITYFGVGTPLKLGKTEHGVGIRFINDRFGLFTNQTMHLQYNFKKRLGNGILSVGADLGFLSLGFAGDSITPVESDYHDFSSDPEIPQTREVGMSFDMTAGLFYTINKSHIGISYSHLNAPIIKWGERTEFRPRGTMYINGGYYWKLAPYPKFVIRPGALFKTDFTTFQLDVSALVEYNEKYIGGLNYRVQDAIVFLLGMNVLDGLYIGYAYDLPTTKIINISSGGHEMFVSYSFEYVFGKRKNKYKSIRIL
jgi:type IX secretion system PorP/SprF family membrane protein